MTPYPLQTGDRVILASGAIVRLASTGAPGLFWSPQVPGSSWNSQGHVLSGPPGASIVTVLREEPRHADVEVRPTDDEAMLIDERIRELAARHSGAGPWRVVETKREGTVVVVGSAGVNVSGTVFTCREAAEWFAARANKIRGLQ